MKPTQGPLSRRSALSFFALGLLTAAACKRETAAAGQRCALCGMKVDPSSPWRTLLVREDGGEVAFDTPRCALAAWRRGKVPARALRVQEFYDRTWLDGAELRFVIGSDVTGPMGPDFVPVAAARADKFVKDHGGDRTLTLAEVTQEIVDQVK